jgi:hypothetical protein
MPRDYKIARNPKDGLEPVRKPTELEIAWAAGIYEGEGSCNTTAKRSNTFSVQVTQKDPELLYKMRDLFGGSVKEYNNGGFMIHHWRTSGNKGRVFLACIYPFLTARRKAQIDATGARTFLDDVSDLIAVERQSAECAIYRSLWDRIEQKEVESRKLAKEFKTKRMTEHYAQNSSNPEFMEKRRQWTAAWRARKKQEKQLLNVVEMKKIA